SPSHPVRRQHVEAGRWSSGPPAVGSLLDTTRPLTRSADSLSLRRSTTLDTPVARILPNRLWPTWGDGGQVGSEKVRCAAEGGGRGGRGHRGPGGGSKPRRSLAAV